MDGRKGDGEDHRGLERTESVNRPLQATGTKSDALGASLARFYARPLVMVWGVFPECTLNLFSGFSKRLVVTDRGPNRLHGAGIVPMHFLGFTERARTPLGSEVFLGQIRFHFQASGQITDRSAGSGT